MKKVLCSCFNITRNFFSHTVCFADLGKLNLHMVHHGGSIISSSPLLLLPKQPLKTTLTIKVAKIDSKIIFLLPIYELMCNRLYVFGVFFFSLNIFVILFQETIYKSGRRIQLENRIPLHLKKSLQTKNPVEYLHLPNCMCNII
jgi:hypothetical protein